MQLNHFVLDFAQRNEDTGSRSVKMLLKCTARGEILIGELYLFRMR